MVPEGAHQWIVQPGKTAQLKEAVKLFGNDSPQMQGIREHAIKELSGQIEVLANRGKGRIGNEIKDAINKYTVEQQEILFPNGLARDLRKLSDKLAFVLPKAAEEAMPGMAAGSKLDLPFGQRVWYQATIALQRRIVQSPTLTRALALGLDNGPTPLFNETIKNMIREVAIEENQDQQGPMPMPQQQPQRIH